MAVRSLVDKDMNATQGDLPHSVLCVILGRDPWIYPALVEHCSRGECTMVSERMAVNRAKIVHEIIDDEVIMINLETGTYYNLVDAGVDIWHAVEEGLSRQQLIEAMVGRYAAERDEVEAAVNALVDELMREEIVVLEEGDGSPDPPFVRLEEPEALPFEPPTLSVYTNMADLLLLDPIHDVDEQGWPSHPPV
jgi:hypothetical protein